MDRASVVAVVIENVHDHANEEDDREVEREDDVPDQEKGNELFTMRNFNIN